MIDDEIEKAFFQIVKQSIKTPDPLPEKKGCHQIDGKQFGTEAEADQYAKDNGLIVYNTWRARMKRAWCSVKRTDQNGENFNYGHKRPKKPTPTK
jgi:hypothetical protein